MGRLAWSYTTDWKADPAEALAAARQECLERGEYERVPAELVEPIVAELAGLAGLGLDLLTGEPTTPDQALLLSAPGGTRSIIDIQQIGAEPDLLTAAPVPEAILREVLGSPVPDPATAEAHRWDLLEALDLGRGEGAYFSVWEDGSPTSICFVGWSID